MSSMRICLASGSVLAGLGAAMLCATGLASADSGSEQGSPTPSAHAVVGPRSAHSAAKPNLAAALQRPAAAVATIATSRISKAAAQVQAAASTLPTRPAAAATGPAAASVGSNRPTRRLPGATSAPIPVVPSQEPVDPAEFAGTYYEQGSVKQFFSLGLVNTKAVYSLNPDGTIRVQNSGNYFVNGGPRSSIVGSAVPVNANNTELNVSFLPFNSATPPGNYTILAHAPDYNWVIVSDPTGYSGYILTRDQKITPQDYQILLAQARSLGVRGPITPTTQYSS